MRALVAVATLVTAFALVTLTAGTAEAKGIGIYNTGEKIFDCGPLPAPWTEDTYQGKEVRAGYACEITGVFWSYFSVKNCKPVAYVVGEDAVLTANDADEHTRREAAIKAMYPESSMKRGFWGRFGWMILAGVIALGIIIGIKEKFSKPKGQIG
jgi:hypothetical protein